jgi:hypothetical protein
VTKAALALQSRITATQPSLGSPDELLDVGVGDNHGLVVNLGGVLVEGVGGLRAEVAVLEVEVKRADAVRAADAGELRAALDPLGGVVSHNLIVSPRRRGNGVLWSGGEGNLGRPQLALQRIHGQMSYPDNYGSS